MLQLNHKNLRVWEKSIELVTQIYTITETYPNEEVFGLVSQLRRASVSIPSNISEGSSRSSSKERKRFYEIARSSLVEIDTQLEISKALHFITDTEVNTISALINEIFAMLSIMKDKT